MTIRKIPRTLYYNPDFNRLLKTELKRVKGKSYIYSPILDIYFEI